jgi:transcriptional regulator with XRE-family HTH domain
VFSSRRGAAAVPGTNPTVRQRELGKRLRDLRLRHDLTVEAVAERLLCSATKISRLETGARRPSLRDVRDLCSLYQVDDSTSAELMSLARGAREEGWWARYEDLNLYPYIGLEEAAVAITAYSMYYVPALAQTEEYARAIIKGIAPKIAADIHEQRVEVRMRRQLRLEQENPPRYRMLVDEAVLHRQVGGPSVMIAQLERLLEMERRRNVTIQVIPFDAGAHAAQDSAFVFLEFDEESDLLPVVYVEGLIVGQYYERRSDTARYREAIDSLRDAALSPRDSLVRIAELKEAHRKMEPIR